MKRSVENTYREMRSPRPQINEEESVLNRWWESLSIDEKKKVMAKKDDMEDSEELDEKPEKKTGESG